MLWSLGIILAVVGGTISILGIHSSKHGADENQLIIFYSLGFTGVVYSLLLLILFYDFPSYANYIVLMMGISTLGTNIGRAYVSPEIFNELSQNRKILGRAIYLYGSLFETFLIFTLLIGVLSYSILQTAEIPVNVIKYVLITMSAAASGGAIIMSIFIKNGYSKGNTLQNDLLRFLILSVPGDMVIVGGLVISLMFLMPYLQ